MKFTQENLTLFLSIFATLTSLILSWLKIKENRDKSVRKFKVQAYVNKPFTELVVNISNKGYRPITIKGYQIIYGNEFVNKIVLKSENNNYLKLQESDIERISIQRDEIIGSRNRNRVIQEYSCELWFKLELSTGETSLNRIKIDSSIAFGVNDKKAISYISTDLFLGYEQLPLKLDPMSRTSKYPSRR